MMNSQKISQHFQRRKNVKHDTFNLGFLKSLASDSIKPFSLQKIQAIHPTSKLPTITPTGSAKKNPHGNIKLENWLISADPYR